MKNSKPLATNYTDFTNWFLKNPREFVKSVANALQRYQLWLAI